MLRTLQNPISLKVVSWGFAAVTLAAFIAMYLPVLVVALLSFFSVRRGVVQWDSFSFDAFAALAANADLTGVLTNSIIIAAATSFLAVALAGILALLVSSRMPRAVVAVVEFIVFLPFVLPPIVTGLSLLIAFRDVGLARGLAAVTVGHVVVVLAVVYSTIINRLRALSPTLVAASADLGANGWQTFWFVVLPQISSALVAAGVLAFALSLDETVVTLFLVGDSSTLPIRLYSLMRVGISAEVNALATLVIGFTTVVAILAGRILLRNNSHEGKNA